MAEILVSGYYGFRNAGDEAILAGMIHAVRDLAPETNFHVISGTVAHTREVHGVGAISRGDFRNIWRTLAQTDLVISGGGSLLQDVTSSKSLAYYLGIISMGQLRRKPVMLYAQGIGPVTHPVGKSLIPKVANRVDLITVRDAESGEALRRLGIYRPPITVTADAALALGPSDPDWGAALLQAAGADLHRPVIGVSVRAWKQGELIWKPRLARVLDTLVRETGAQVVFIPMQQPKDVWAARTITHLMEMPAVLAQQEYSHAEVRAMIARCNLIIGMRYHALVFAAMNGVPLVGFSYDPKTDSFLRLIGESAAGTTSRLEIQKMVAASRRALSEAPVIRQRLVQRMAELMPLSRRNAELAVELLRQRGRL